MIESFILVAACSWNDPGQDRFRGAPAAAVASYSDIPVEQRNELVRKVAQRAFDDVAEIRRDTLVGKSRSYADLRDMHFGANRRCATVDRSGWPEGAVERGLVYCVAARHPGQTEQCVIVPTVCNNVSRVTPLKELPAQAPAGSQVVAGLATTPFAAPSPTFEELSGPAPILPLSEPPPVRTFWAAPPPQWAPPPVQLTYVVPGIVEPPMQMLFIFGLAAVAAALTWRRGARRGRESTGDGSP